MQNLRILIRKNYKAIIDHLITFYIKRYNGMAYDGVIPDICMFCSSVSNLTKEHVLPRWVFQKKTEEKFVLNINGQNQTYNKTTLPACENCNTIVLNELEKEINKVLTNNQLPNIFFSNEENENMIRWLEIIDYKFQLIHVTRKFRASKKAGHIPFLSDFPLAVLNSNLDYSPNRVVTELRCALKRISVKSKHNRLNSLVVFKTDNKEMNFFYKSNEYIFIELPHKKVALLYFYQKIFERVEDARDAALGIIKQSY